MSCPAAKKQLGAGGSYFGIRLGPTAGGGVSLGLLNTDVFTVADLMQRLGFRKKMKE